MRGPGPARTGVGEETVVPEGPGRAVAVASALAVAAALAAAAGRAVPAPVSITREDPGGAAGEGDPPAALPAGTPVLIRVVAGLRSGDPAVRRETAGIVERLAKDLDPGGRLALVAALAALGGREARLPLCLLAGDDDALVRVAARRALLEMEAAR